MITLEEVKTLECTGNDSKRQIYWSNQAVYEEKGIGLESLCDHNDNKYCGGDFGDNFWKKPWATHIHVHVHTQ